MVKAKNIYDFLGSILLGWAIIIMTSPIFLAWWLSDYERYIWTISGPEPFRRFGSGPYMLGMFFIMEFIGLSVLTVGVIFRRNSK